VILDDVAPARARRRGTALALAVGTAVLAAACTGTPGAGPARDDGGGTGVRPSPEPAPSGDPAASPVPSPAPARQPLVLAVNARRPPIDVPAGLARRILRGEVFDWAALGQPAGPLVVSRRAGAAGNPPWGTLVVAPAHQVGPGAQAVDVNGVDPFRRPGRYPLTTTAPMPPGTVTTLTVVGDLMLGRRVGDRAAAAGDPSYQLRPMQDRLAAADLTVGNLESTLSDRGAPTQGGDSFAADPRVRAGLRDAGFDAIGLANNHLGDFGDRALVESVELLREGGFATFGAGRDLRRAAAPAILERDGVRVGFLGFNAIGETPEAGPGRPGALSVSMPPRTGPLDRAELRRVMAAVRRLARQVDTVVVLPHWGTQYTSRPEPVQVDVARQLVAAGADVVVGGHPHWVQGASIVDGALVVHSLGNFVFDMDFSTETMEGLVLELVLWDGEVKQADFVPYRIGADFAPRVVPHTSAAAMFARFREFGNLGR
jgi:poly-gamma-glutamate capsule biosynthesis protein CapA/YwtB (metallophosphatase superfamily)